jgi:hypothetical protein
MIIPLSLRFGESQLHSLARLKKGWISDITLLYKRVIYSMITEHVRLNVKNDSGILFVQLLCVLNVRYD